MNHRIGFVLLCLVAAGCASTPASTSSTAPAAELEARAGDIVESPSGRLLTFDRMIAGLRSDRAVYVGESHNSVPQHEFQLRVVRAMYEQDPRLLIGMEMFQRPYQPALDRFIAGETTEAEFLKESEYFIRWRWDWHYYRPILLFAREHGIPVVALNSPREANQRVSRGGGLDALTEEDRQWVAEEIDLTIEAHREFVMQVFEGHPMPPGFDKEAFYASQCVWEDTMAESTARALDAHPDHRIVVLVGTGHVRKRFGVPIRAERRGATPYSILVGLDVVGGEPAPLAELLPEDLGDILYFTAHEQGRGESPRLGIAIDRKFQGKGVRVSEVSKGSIANLAGVAAGDVIVGLAGRTVEDSSDLRIALALLDTRMSNIVLMRGEETLDLTFDVAWGGK